MLAVAGEVSDNASPQGGLGRRRLPLVRSRPMICAGSDEENQAEQPAAPPLSSAPSPSPRIVLGGDISAGSSLHAGLDRRLLGSIHALSAPSRFLEAATMEGQAACAGRPQVQVQGKESTVTVPDKSAAVDTKELELVLDQRISVQCILSDEYACTTDVAKEKWGPTHNTITSQDWVNQGVLDGCATNTYDCATEDQRAVQQEGRVIDKQATSKDIPMEDQTIASDKSRVTMRENPVESKENTDEPDATQSYGFVAEQEREEHCIIDGRGDTTYDITVEDQEEQSIFDELGATENGEASKDQEVADQCRLTNKRDSAMDDNAVENHEVVGRDVIERSDNIVVEDQEKWADQWTLDESRVAKEEDVVEETEKVVEECVTDKQGAVPIDDDFNVKDQLRAHSGVPVEYEFSWRTKRLNGQDILPPVHDQGLRPSCIFHSLCVAAEMEIRRSLALESPSRATDLMFNVNSFISEYEDLVEATLGRDDGPNRVSTAVQMFVQGGVYARASHWNRESRIALSGAYPQHGIEFEEVADLILQGRPVIGGFQFCDQFEHLGPGDIYRLLPSNCKTWPPLSHMVVFVGFGWREGKHYLVFMNHGGSGFGDGGFGRIWFDQVRDFMTVSVHQEDKPRPPSSLHQRSNNRCCYPSRRRYSNSQEDELKANSDVSSPPHEQTSHGMAEILELNRIGLPINSTRWEDNALPSSAHLKESSHHAATFDYPSYSLPSSAHLKESSDHAATFDDPSYSKRDSGQTTLDDTFSSPEILLPSRHNSTTDSKKSVELESRPATRITLKECQKQQQYPERPGQPNCRYYIQFGKCYQLSACMFHHPKDRLPTGCHPLDASHSDDLCQQALMGPEIHGIPECPFYIKAGRCRFGSACEFRHLKDRCSTKGEAIDHDVTDLTSANFTRSEYILQQQEEHTLYPERPDEPDCSYYMKHGSYKFQMKCRYHHPRY